MIWNYKAQIYSLRVYLSEIRSKMEVKNENHSMDNIRPSHESKFQNLKLRRKGPKFVGLEDDWDIIECYENKLILYQASFKILMFIASLTLVVSNVFFYNLFRISKILPFPVDDLCESICYYPLVFIYSINL